MKRVDSGVGIDHLEARSTTPRKAAAQDARADHSHLELLQVDGEARACALMVDSGLLATKLVSVALSAGSPA